MRVSLVLAVAALALAGCSGKDGADGGATDGRVPEGALVITDPADDSALRAGTDGSGWHVHDYWRGEDRLVLLDQDGPSCTGCIATYNGEQGAFIGSFRPDVDHVVPQGTAIIEVTATWSLDEAQSEYDHVALWVKTAATARFANIGMLTQGDTLTFASTNDDNDPPHQRLSGWRFQIRAMPTDDSATIASYSSALTVQVVRGLDIPAWPAHPDLWGGATEMTLYDHTGADGSDISLVVFATCTSPCANLVWRPADGMIVPYDAREVHVDITFEGGPVHMFGVRYHGGDSWDYRDVEPAEGAADGSSLHYVIDPTGAADSPYAKQSVWEFWLYSDQPADPFVRAWQGGYQITVTAIQ